MRIFASILLLAAQSSFVNADDPTMPPIDKDTNACMAYVKDIYASTNVDQSGVIVTVSNDLLTAGTKTGCLNGVKTIDPSKAGYSVLDFDNTDTMDGYEAGTTYNYEFTWGASSGGVKDPLTAMITTPEDTSTNPVIIPITDVYFDTSITTDDLKAGGDLNEDGNVSVTVYADAYPVQVTYPASTGVTADAVTIGPSAFPIFCHLMTATTIIPDGGFANPGDKFNITAEECNSLSNSLAGSIAASTDCSVLDNTATNPDDIVTVTITLETVTCDAKGVCTPPEETSTTEIWTSAEQTAGISPSTFQTLEKFSMYIPNSVSGSEDTVKYPIAVPAIVMHTTLDTTDPVYMYQSCTTDQSTGDNYVVVDASYIIAGTSGAASDPAKYSIDTDAEHYVRGIEFMAYGLITDDNASSGNSPTVVLMAAVGVIAMISTLF